MKDSYHTITAKSIGEFKDRGSKFIAYAYPANSDEQWQTALLEVKKEHPKARHHCYAFRIGMDKNHFRANDDGEPSGTAGRPILGQIDSFGLTDLVVIVVRYFGGTLLGASGLINAYRLSARDALSQATIVERFLENRFKITFDYAQMGELMNAVKKLELNILEQFFEDTAYLVIGIRKSATEAALNRLKALLAKVSLEEAQEMEWEAIEGIEIEDLG